MIGLGLAFYWICAAFAIAIASPKITKSSDAWLVLIFGGFMVPAAILSKLIGGGDRGR